MTLHLIITGYPYLLLNSNTQFNHFLIKDDEPLLYHAGLKGLFPLLHEAVKPLRSKNDTLV